MPAPAPDPNLSAHLQVLKTHCISCHSGYHSSWNDLVTDQDWIDSGLVNKNSPETSLIILISKNNPYSAGGTMPKVNNGYTVAQVNTLIAWINNMKDEAPAPSPAPAPAPAPSPSPTPGDGSFLIATNSSTRIGNAQYISSVLLDIFGSSISSEIEDSITKRVSAFGSPCGPYNDYLACDDIDSKSYDNPIYRNSTVAREGWRIKACKQSVISDSAVDNALSHIGRSVASAPNNTDLKSLYGLFNPGMEPSDAVITKLKAVSDKAQTLSASNKNRESWRYVLYTLCLDPIWQMY